MSSPFHTNVYLRNDLPMTLNATKLKITIICFTSATSPNVRLFSFTENRALQEGKLTRLRDLLKATESRSADLQSHVDRERKRQASDRSLPPGNSTPEQD